MDPLRPKQNHTPGAQVIGTDRINEEIIKRIDTHDSAQRVDHITDSREGNVTRAAVHFMLLNFFLLMVSSFSYRKLSPRINLDMLLAKNEPRYNSALIECYSYLGYYYLLKSDYPVSKEY